MNHHPEIQMVCRVCCMMQLGPILAEGTRLACCRCGASLNRVRKGGLERTAALTLAALLLFVPANLYPILTMNLYGVYSESTIWDGCVALHHAGQWPVALIVFLASMVIPLLKQFGLLYLVTTTRMHKDNQQRERTALYRAIDLMGPWAMLDVFLLAVLVALVKLGQLATIRPGPGLLAFAAMVVLTLLASANFDARWIWEKEESIHD